MQDIGAQDSRGEQPGPHPHVIDFTVDGQNLTTTERELTPNQIMALAGIDGSTHYLVQIEGRHRTSYKDQNNVAIHLHEGATFISVSTGPTPVS